MSLTIFSFQRAFTAKQKMALAAGNSTNSLAAIEAKDILDALYLGLNCEVRASEEVEDTSSTVNEFITCCPNLIQKLSDPKSDQITIQLPTNHNLSLNEQNGNIQMRLDSDQVTLTNLTMQHLYNNLIQDIQNNPDLYGSHLASYAQQHSQPVSCALL